MADPVTSAAIVALTVAALLIFLSALRKARARGEWSGAATLGAMIVLLTISFVELFVTYLGLWDKERNAYKSVTWSVPPMAHGVMRLLALILAVIAAAVFVVRLRRKHTVVNVPAVLFLLIEIVSAESALVHGDNPFRPLSVVFSAVVLACTVAPRGLGIHVGVGTACMIVAIASGFTFYIHRDFSVFACTSDSLTSDKCGLFNFNFRGILENENALAMYLALAMPLRLHRIWIMGGHDSFCLHPLSRHDDRRSLRYDRRSRRPFSRWSRCDPTSGSLPPHQCAIVCFTWGFRARCSSASCCRTSPRTQTPTTVVPGCGSWCAIRSQIPRRSCTELECWGGNMCATVD